jgi:predicted AAA+ superfamily ATPase
MALSNRDRVGKGLELLSEGLVDIVDDVMTRKFASSNWNELWANEIAEKRGGAILLLNKDDVAVQLKAITEEGYSFKDILSRTQQGFAQELREVRNAWAHSDPFDSEDAQRALDTMERLLRAVDAVDSGADIHKLLEDLRKTVSREQARTVLKHHVDIPTGTGLKPWREVISPHGDVASGNFNASEFAADLYLVANGGTQSEEYANPVEFFNRTYLTEGLKDLLTRAIKRLGGDATASPVVNLQTNFGGGKTHSMLALYHLFGGTPVHDFSQEVQDLIASSGGVDVASLGVRRAVLVGTYLQAGAPVILPDGTEVNTLWGELAWQLGGREGYELVASADQTGTNPGEALRTLISQYSPCVILIDEWVAYARQLVGKEYPAGTFDTQFTFAQNLTEVVRSTPGAMLIVSIPASDTGSSATAGNDIEVGGENGQKALERLQNVIRRVADQWRPSSKDESFEIVRRRLFQEPDATGQTVIHATARAFTKWYGENTSTFPREAAAQNCEYEKRIISSYPLHPELLDRLYEDWSTLERFQRTRGVLKLVNSMVHALWASDDNSPLIMPCSVPLDDTAVNTDLTQYLEDSWKPIIDADIDGDNSTAAGIDQSRTNLGQRHITRRLARTVFMGAAPKARSAHRGLDKQRVWLGTAIPGDQLGNFGTALDLLSQNSTFFYTENERYWFDTQASITKAARDKAEQLREDPELVFNEIVRRLNMQGQQRDVFDRVHIAPESGADIPDTESVRLVVAHPRFTYKRGSQGVDNEATLWVKKSLESKGAGQRVNRNTLVFLLADGSVLDSLEASVREFLGWKHVDTSAETLDLTSQQQTQARNRVTELNGKVDALIDSTYVWSCYPEQSDPAKPFTLEFVKVSESSGSGLAKRVSTKLFRDDQLISNYAPTSLGWTLRKELASVWARGEVSVGELWGYYTQYLYMDRLLDRGVLDGAVLGALNLLSFETQTEERFAIATDKDPATGRYIGLILPPANANLQVTDKTLLVGWEVAQEQLAADAAAAAAAAGTSAGLIGGVDGVAGVGGISPAAEPTTEGAGGQTPPRTTEPHPAQQTGPTRYFGAVKINSALYAKELASINREILERLQSAGAALEISLEIQATKPDGFTESEIRTIKENSNNLKFDSSGFEVE